MSLVRTIRTNAKQYTRATEGWHIRSVLTAWMSPFGCFGMTSGPGCRKAYRCFAPHPRCPLSLNSAQAGPLPAQCTTRQPQLGAAFARLAIASVPFKPRKVLDKAAGRGRLRAASGHSTLCCCHRAQLSAFAGIILDFTSEVGTDRARSSRAKARSRRASVRPFVPARLSRSFLRGRRRRG